MKKSKYRKENALKFAKKKNLLKDNKDYEKTL